ncbi:MAG: 3-deoxy-D-manno-octulosonic acid transferase [Pelovirga sp.]
MYLLYNLLLLLSGLFLVPFYQFHGWRHGKSHRGIRERLGAYTVEQKQRLQEAQVIWIHAVSVGETRAAIPLISALRRSYPDHLILVTSVTETGHAIAMENSQVDLCLFFPFDFSWTVRKVLRLINPAIVIIVETEIWPNFCRQAKGLNIPLVLINGRISDRSYPRYRLVRVFLAPLLESFCAFCMQSQTDVERIIALGAPPQRVENSGNLKFDRQLQIATTEEVLRKKSVYRLPQDAAIMVAGSTRSGEERLLVEAYRKIADRIDRPLLLVLIPRHPERCREVQGLLKDMGASYRLRSLLTPNDQLLAAGEILIGDTLGEVMTLYSVADLVFVGGSLVPIGGHNLLEAALVGKPVLFGPYMENFKEISAKLVRAGAGLQVQDGSDLERQSIILLNDPARCRAMGEAGQVLIKENAGAVERTMAEIDQCLVARA